MRTHSLANLEKYINRGKRRKRGIQGVRAHLPELRLARIAPREYAVLFNRFAQED